MKQRCTAIRNWISVPVRMISKLKTAVTKQVESPATDFFCVGEHLCAMTRRADRQRRTESRVERPFEESLFSIANEPAEAFRVVL